MSAPLYTHEQWFTWAVSNYTPEQYIYHTFEHSDDLYHMSAPIYSFLHAWAMMHMSKYYIHFWALLVHTFEQCNKWALINLRMSINIPNIHMSNLKLYSWASMTNTFEQFAHEQRQNIHMSSIIVVLAHDNFEKHTWAILTDDSGRYTWALCTLAGLHLSSVHIHMSTYISVLMCSTRFLWCDEDFYV